MYRSYPIVLYAGHVARWSKTLNLGADANLAWCADLASTIGSTHAFALHANACFVVSAWVIGAVRSWTSSGHSNDDGDHQNDELGLHDDEGRGLKVVGID